MASKLLADDQSAGINTLDLSDRLAARFIAISALLLEENTTQAKLKLEQFASDYKSAEPNWERHWDYSGTRHFIEVRRMDGVSKTIILNLIKLLGKNPPEATIEQIEKLTSTLQ